MSKASILRQLTELKRATTKKGISRSNRLFVDSGHNARNGTFNETCLGTRFFRVNYLWKLTEPNFCPEKH
ncbi:MAG: hypothetical protein ACJ0KA_00810 [Verrucomicrobiales bacterium]